MISCDKTISMIAAELAINVKPANCPAEVKFVADMNTASNGLRPACFARIPKVNDTAKYPKAIGIPFFNNPRLHYLKFVLNFSPPMMSFKGSPYFILMMSIKTFKH